MENTINQTSLKMKTFMSFHRQVLLFATLGLFTLLSCGNNFGAVATEQSVVLNMETANLSIGEELLLEPNFTPDVQPQHTYSWRTSNPEVAGVEMNDDHSAIVTARQAGAATIEFYSAEAELSASVDLVVQSADDDGIIKVLAIGNSFSEDALENYLYEMAGAENVPMVIGNLYIGGASLEQHWNNAQANAPAYDYRKIKEGERTNTPETTIEAAIKDENWDYISFQQVSGSSGKYETFVEPLPAMLDYVKDRTTNPEVQYILHQTWAYSENSTHSNFPNYGSDQVAMYEALVDAIRRAKIAHDIDFVVPAGTAIQNGRNTLIGDNFTRDGYHLDLGIGRYTAASTWFEALTGLSAVGNSFAPETLTETEVAIAQHAAHAAVLDPDRVTILSDYQAGDAESRR